MVAPCIYYYMVMLYVLFSLNKAIYLYTVSPRINVQLKIDCFRHGSKNIPVRL